MVRGRGRRDPRTLRGGTKRERLDSFLGDNLIRSLDQGSAQIAVMIRGSFRHKQHLYLYSV
jgi:hypothetical protein